MMCAKFDGFETWGSCDSFYLYIYIAIDVELAQIMANPERGFAKLMHSLLEFGTVE